jgi:uncharacterized protein YutE (UPF0331/DUF86 family)
MIPAQISERVISDRLGLVAEYLRNLRELPLADRERFLADRRNVAAAESFLRRSLEALLDIGRHILAKGFAAGVTEYKEIALRAKDLQLLPPAEADLLFMLAGYRNRMVHFYHEITPDELYQICASQLSDLERVADAYRAWLHAHPDRIDRQL